MADTKISAMPNATLPLTGAEVVPLVQGGVNVKATAAQIGGTSLQLVTYTVGTPANPPNQTAPAIAYDPTGNLPMLGWNTGTLTWN